MVTSSACFPVQQGRNIRPCLGIKKPSKNYFLQATSPCPKKKVVSDPHLWQVLARKIPRRQAARRQSQSGSHTVKSSSRWRRRGVQRSERPLSPASCSRRTQGPAWRTTCWRPAMHRKQPCGRKAISLVTMTALPGTCSS